MTKYFSINERGFSVRCKLYCTDERSVTGAVIFGHGFGGNKDNKIAEKLADRMQKRHPDIALVTFDWPCHGDDARNKPILSDCLDYLELVIRYVKNRYRADTIYGTANSFGGYVFLRYINQRGNPFARAALRCPAVNMYEILTQVIMTEDDLKALKKNKPVPVGFERKVKITSDFAASLKDADVMQCDYSPQADSLIILHGTKDEIVSFDTVRQFAQANQIPFFAIENADHKFTNPACLDEVINRIQQFLLSDPEHD